LFPTERARVIQLLMERVDLGEGGISIGMRTKELASLVQHLRSGRQPR